MALIKEEAKKKSIKEELKENIAEIVSSLFVVILSVMIIFEKKQYIITAISAIFILVIGLEKRAGRFDRIVAASVIFVLSVGFMFI